jgi:hypothetical protein
VGVGSKPLHMAAGGGNVSNTRALVELGARLEAKAAEHHGETPLRSAVNAKQRRRRRRWWRWVRTWARRTATA